MWPASACAPTPAKGGWTLAGTKSYVTNGAVADLAVITAVTDPGAPRNSRLSMFLVDLGSEGVRRTPLNKQVWVPSDLTRLELRDVFVPEDHLLGARGRGLQQVLAVFSHSRVPIAALSLGTAAGAFDLAVRHARKRAIFGRKVADFQAKSFEIAELHAAIEAARLMLWKACWKMDAGEDFRGGRVPGEIPVGGGRHKDGRLGRGHLRCRLGDPRAPRAQVPHGRLGRVPGRGHPGRSETDHFPRAHASATRDGAHGASRIFPKDSPASIAR